MQTENKLTKIKVSGKHTLGNSSVMSDQRQTLFLFIDNVS